MLLSVNLYAASDDPRPEPSRGYIGAGAAVVIFDTSVTLANDKSPIDFNIDLEDTVGLNTTNHVNTFYGELNFGEKHRINVGYFSIKRDSYFLAEEITYKGDTLGNVSVDVSDHTRFFDLTYGYNLLNNDHNRITAEIGLFTLDMTMKLNASGQLSLLKQTRTETYYDEVDALAPLPLFGLDFKTKLSPKWSLGTKIAMVYGEYDGISAGVLRTRITGHYQISRHFGLTTGLNYFDAKVDIEKNSESQTVDYGYKGAYLGLDYRF